MVNHKCFNLVDRLHCKSANKCGWIITSNHNKHEIIIHNNHQMGHSRKTCVKEDMESPACPEMSTCQGPVENEDQGAIISLRFMKNYEVK